MAITQLAAGKHVFLRATSVITTVMLSMTSEDAKEQKAAHGRKKVRLTPVKNNNYGEAPLWLSTRGNDRFDNFNGEDLEVKDK